MRRQAAPVVLLFAAAVLSLAENGIAGGLSVTEWLLGIGIYDSQSGDSAGYSIGTVNNPFVDAQKTHLGLSSCDASYNFSWTGDEASFRIGVDQHSEDLDGEVSSSGRIRFTVAADSVFGVQAAYSYAFPAAELTNIRLSALLYDLTLDQFVLSEFRGGGTVHLYPPSGVLAIDRQLELIAGHSYVFSYMADMFHYGLPPPGAFGTGDGEIRYTISPIPEPAVTWLLAAAAWGLRRRRGRARQLAES